VGWEMDENGDEVREARQENAAEDGESDQELDESDESDEDFEGLVASEEELMREKVVRDAIAQLQAGETLLRSVALAALRRRSCSLTSISDPPLVAAVLMSTRSAKRAARRSRRRSRAIRR
jgi:hypothetical protein